MSFTIFDTNLILAAKYLGCRNDMCSNDIQETLVKYVLTTRNERYSLLKVTEFDLIYLFLGETSLMNGFDSP